MSELDERFRTWEMIMQRQSLSSRRHEDGLVELRPQPSPAEQVAADTLQERWAQQYVKEHFARLGFSKVDGPFHRGPDYRFTYKRRWVWAEVETRWRNYLRHGHHGNPAFDDVKYLILLSAEAPTPDALKYLPPKIVHIDQQHFLGWYVKAAQSELLGKEFGTRVDIVAGEMQHHWTTICSDVDREMANCPDCDSCAYFGDGRSGEATAFYRNLASQLLSSTGVTSTGRADMRKLRGRAVQRFVENNPPGE